MNARQRKTSPRVIGGKVQRKNRRTLTPSYWNTRQSVSVIDRREPGRGYRHLVLQRDVFAFIELLPDWAELARGLDAVVLAEGSERCYGWHNYGVIGLCAWNRELWEEVDERFHREHAVVLERLGVPVEREDDLWILKFTESTARAFLLLHVFLHELGHHHDRMTTRSRRGTARGEAYAENYALAYADRIWDGYVDAFGLV